ncbi:MAG: type IV pilin protein [Actinomycetota bacterium]
MRIRGCNAARRGEPDERGFTVLELLIVCLIIAILLAVAIPTFLAARTRAQDRLVQKNLRSVFVAELTYFADVQTYTDNAGGELEEIESGLRYGTGMTPDDTKHAWLGLAGGRVYISAKSRSGSCFYLREDSLVGTNYATDPDCKSALLQIYTADPW